MDTMNEHSSTKSSFKIYNTIRFEKNLLTYDKGRVRSWDREKLQLDIDSWLSKHKNQWFFVSIPKDSSNEIRSRTPNSNCKNIFFASRKSSTSTNNRSKQSRRHKQKSKANAGIKPTVRKSLFAPIQKPKIKKDGRRVSKKKRIQSKIFKNEVRQSIISLTKCSPSVFIKKASRSLEYVSMKDICV